MFYSERDMNLPPDVAEADGGPDAGQEERGSVAPRLTVVPAAHFRETVPVAGSQNKNEL